MNRSASIFALPACWILPGREVLHALKGRVRTVGQPSKAARAHAREQRYRQGERGRETLEKNRARRAAYQRAWYLKHLEARRAYLAAKAREYRAKKRGGGNG